MNLTKAGGFLAQTWNDGTNQEKLTHFSYNLHKELAETLHGDQVYGFRYVPYVHAVESNQEKMYQSNFPNDLDWCDGKSISYDSLIGNAEQCAQLHPYYFTQSLFNCAVERGAKLVKGFAEDLVKDDAGNVVGVLVDGGVVEADVVVVALGPWTGNFTRNALHEFPFIGGRRAHSVTLNKENAPVLESCVFIDHTYKKNNAVLKAHPEIYTRPDGEVYICGFSDKCALPDRSEDIVVEDSVCEQLVDLGKSFSSTFESYDVTAKQVCYLPTPKDILGPLIREAEKNVFVASGHTCWGILNAPATGYVVADLICKGETEVDISDLC